MGAELRGLGHLLLDGGLWPRIAVAASVAVAFVAASEVASQRRSASRLEPLLATAKVDRLDAYAREVKAAAAFAAPANEANDLDWSTASRRISTHSITGPNGERTYAIRISVPEGTPVRAAADGSVEFAGDAGDGLGAKVILSHGAVKTVYAHARDILVKERERARKGQVIARSGQSGFATSPRLYLALVSADPSVDPVAFFAGSVTGKAERCTEAACDERRSRAAGPTPGARRTSPPAEIPGRPSRPAT
jgi:murein DD-endopeptidase MepM/ murein hydrolase activator NlpD